jgi:thiol-disulfide isomerase/thioredoxin
MKNKFIIPLVVLGSSVFGQFTVSGQLENYANKPVLLKIYDNAELKLLKNTNTDAKGNFTANVPNKYNGFVRVDLPTGENISLLTDNKNIKFKTIVGQEFAKNLNIIEGDAQKEFNKVLALQPLNEVQNQVFPYLMQIYSKNDEFYQAIMKEQNRINTVNNDSKFSGLVQYEKSLNDLRSKIQTSKDNDVLTQIETHLINDDTKLEQSGMFNDLVYAYINLKLSQAGQNNNDIENKVISATDELLAKTDIKKTRGQNILSALLNFVPKDQYPAFHQKYIDQVKGLTNITDQLKKQIGKNSALTVGDKVPNIVFDQTVNGKKSLYDIKANQKLIVFWASWCPACQQEIPHIKEFYKDFKAKGGEIVAISLDFEETAFKNATKDFTWYNYTDLLRWDSPIAAEYNVQSTPTLFLVDKDNKIVKKVNHISELQSNK